MNRTMVRVVGRAAQHYLPGTNPFLNELSDLYRVPYEGVGGGVADRDQN